MNCLHIEYIIPILLVFALLGTVIALKLHWGVNHIHFIAEKFSESNQPIQNPYCGLYHIIGYTLSDENIPRQQFAHTISSYTESLVLLEINLKNYRLSPITEQGLTELNDIFAAWEQSPCRTKLILRFLYDWDGIAPATEPDSIDRVLEHMEQIAPIVNRYHQTVYILQGVFIGNWGEMHHSKFSDPRSIQILINRLHQLIHPTVYLSVRTPSIWRGVNQRYAPPHKFPLDGMKPALCHRLGLFNDGILGSETDLGTYGDTPRKDAESPAYQGTRKEELEFQNRLCRWVPNGGEVVYNQVLSQLETAVSTLQIMHISYMNADYDSRVWDRWKQSVWMSNDAFCGIDGYTYIKAHLGYRYLIDFCKIKRTGFRQPTLTIGITIQNNGFSNTLKPFDAYFALIHEHTGERTVISLDADFRMIQSGKKMTLTAKHPLRPLLGGAYRMYFSVKDPASGQTVFLSNENELTPNGYFLGRLIT